MTVGLMCENRSTVDVQTADGYRRLDGLMLLLLLFLDQWLAALKKYSRHSGRSRSWPAEQYKENY